MSQGSLVILFNRPIAGAITAVAIFFFALPLIAPYWRRRSAAASAAAAQR
jgi:TctA family transporter